MEPTRNQELEIDQKKRRRKEKEENKFAALRWVDRGNELDTPGKARHARACPGAPTQPASLGINITEFASLNLYLEVFRRSPGVHWLPRIYKCIAWRRCKGFVNGLRPIGSVQWPGIHPSPAVAMGWPKLVKQHRR